MFRIYSGIDQSAHLQRVQVWFEITGQKPQFWANYDIFGGSCTDPLLPMRAKFGVLEQTQGLHLQTKFHLNVFIVSASGGQKPQFRANFDILGAPILTPFRR